MNVRNEEIGVAKEVLSYCGKCKLALAHIIVTMKSKTEIGKCQCKTCSAKHNYRDPDVVVKKKTTPTIIKDPAIPPEDIWKGALIRTNGKVKPYAMDKTFKEWDLIDHPTFGKGIVMRLIMNDKIEVQFKDASKLLICSQE